VTDEKKQNQRKQKKLGRSKKEKHSSVPLLASPSPSSDQRMSFLCLLAHSISLSCSNNCSMICVIQLKMFVKVI